MSALLVIYRFPLIQNKSQIGIHKHFNAPTIKVLYMSSSFWVLGVESHDYSHAEREKTEHTHKMTIIFTQNDNLRSILSENSCHFVNLLNSFSLSMKTWEKSRDSTPNSQKLEDM